MAESVGSDNKETLALKQQYAVQQLAGEKKELFQVQSELKKVRAELTVLKDSGAAGEPPDEKAVQAALDREPDLQAMRAQLAKQADRLEHHRRLVRTESDPSVRESRRNLERLRRDEAGLRAELRPVSSPSSPPARATTTAAGVGSGSSRRASRSSTSMKSC